MLLLNFVHRRQHAENDCLVACAAMALNHIGVEIEYERLARLLKAGPFFTPFSHLQQLAALRLSVTLGAHADSTLFEQFIEVGLPVIVGVTTLGWQHWHGEITHHAVVVVGIDRSRDRIYIHDPFFANAPVEMALIEFELGWIEKGQEYAVVSLVTPD